MPRRKERTGITTILVVITEISSAQGDKNSASSTQKNSHSWHKDKLHSTAKGSKLYKNG
jgi:hypothetical protein